MKSWMLRIGGFLFLTFPLVTQAQIGNPAPDFTVTDTHGETHHLYEYLEAGKVVVLDFFYTTCTPCQFYSPQVNLAYQKYGCNTGDVIFMSIDHNDTDAEVLAYDAEYNIVYPSVSGLEGGGNGVVAQYGIIGFPTFYVIDSTKTIIDQIDPPTVQVFDFRFGMHGIVPAECNTTDLQETKFTRQLQLFPNPVSYGHTLHVQLPDRMDGVMHYEVLNSMGQTIKTGNADLKEEQLLEIQVEDMVPDIYMLKVNSLSGNRSYSGLFTMQ